MPTPTDSLWQAEEIRRLLARAPVIQSACDIDLLVFLHRHPRALLTSEQLAGFVGYNIKDMARALEAFIEAGLLARTSQQSLHAARMFLLLLDGTQGPNLSALLELASTRAGRQRVFDVLNGGSGGAQFGQLGGAPELRLFKCA